MTRNFYTAVEERRSIYGITDEIVISNERIEEIIQLAVANTPTAFNSQTGRVVVLLGNSNAEFWQIAFESVKAGLAENRIAKTDVRFKAFADGYGTVLFFEDYEVVQTMQEKFPAYNEQFTEWSHQASGILQYLIWTSLEYEGFGANLQHYIPTFAADIRQKWGIQNGWKLIAQLPFGKPIVAPKEKEIQPLDQRIVIVK
ncbi:nitroreductase family protein [Viridibacillus sp. YIM B01967]|uniref:Nitroreductase family protein n=1 Tax=Viridibacillus soli TaxID=2798301 RepID=A0ABS1H8Z5_9BACL|nr:nitroreductase family protein [Viridibacillus soli]MBK3495567.1 nitroreductase family protein [Viridibacillus soli]